MSRPLKTHCPYGHPYSGENLRVDKRGYRECRTCNGWTGKPDAHLRNPKLRSAKRQPVILDTEKLGQLGLGSNVSGYESTRLQP